MKIKFAFVDVVPDTIEPQTLYVSIKYRTAIHLCCCGCGGEVVTPLDPKEWKLIYDGESVSLSPSIGNWSTTCKSHYWITNNTVRWSNHWTADQIAINRNVDRSTKMQYFNSKENKTESIGNPPLGSESMKENITPWNKLKSLFKWW